MKTLLHWFLHYGLAVSVLVWAGAVGLMAYHLDDSPWRWAFAALSVGGVATIGAIIWIRKYIDRQSEAVNKGTSS